VSIPLPGTSFLYSLLKDVGRWCWPKLHGYRLPRVAAFQQWTVDQWYRPYDAIQRFGDQGWVQRRNEARNEQSRLAAALHEHRCKFGEGWAPDVADTPAVAEAKERERALHEQWEAANSEFDHFDYLLSEDLHDRLLSGELIARGFNEPFAHGAPYLTISRHEWLIINLQDQPITPVRAEGNGISYIGITIGKPGTKRLFGCGR
jgi:hypothetical protein